MRTAQGMWRALWLGAACTLAVAAPAGAAKKVALGKGSEPGVAIDAAGTAHIAFNGDFDPNADPARGEPLTLCSLPRASRTCVRRELLVDGAAPSAQPPLLATGPAPGDVTIVSSRERLTVLRSADGVATFGPPAAFGKGRYFDGAFGPDGAMAFTFRNLGYMEFYGRNLAGPADLETRTELNRGHAVDGDVAFDGTRPVLVSGARVPKMAVSTWTGAGDVNDASTWAGPFTIAKASYFALASGPRGVFLAHERPGLDDRVVVRRLNGQRFTRGSVVPAGRIGLPSVIGIDLAQDAAGRLLAVWYDADRDSLEVSASKTGRRWTPARVLVRGVDLPQAVKVALGADGRGAVTWAETGDVFAAKVSARDLLKRARKRRP